MRHEQSGLLHLCFDNSMGAGAWSGVLGWGAEIFWDVRFGVWDQGLGVGGVASGLS